MAQSKGVAGGNGYSANGGFGSGGVHNKGGIMNTMDGGRGWLLNDNGHMCVESTAGTV